MVRLVIAEADTKEEIEEHWKWIDEHLLPALATIDAGVDVTDYVQSKIKSLCAQVDEAEIDGRREAPSLSLQPPFRVDFESDKFKNATKKFHKLFNIPVDEKLVTCQYTYFSSLSLSRSPCSSRLFLFVLARSRSSPRVAVSLRQLPLLLFLSIGERHHHCPEVYGHHGKGLPVIDLREVPRF